MPREERELRFPLSGARRINAVAWWFEAAACQNQILYCQMLLVYYQTLCMAETEALDVSGVGFLDVRRIWESARKDKKPKQAQRSASCEGLVTAPLSPCVRSL